MLLVGLAALALGVRLALLFGSGWLLEGDDALSALMALGILERGERPIMLKNQTYAGAWEPYAMAASFAAFGVSRMAAKLPAMAASLAFLGATWLLAREVAGRMAAVFALALVALPPTYVLVLGLKPWAPYTEVMVLGTVALWAAVRLASPRPRQQDARWALGGGLAGGLAFWLHPLAVVYLLPAALLVVVHTYGARGPVPAADTAGMPSCPPGHRLGRIAAWALGGFLLGALPVWLFNLQTGGATLRFVLAGTRGATADRWAVLAAWWNADLPRGLGLWQPWGHVPYPAALALGLILAAAVLWALLAVVGGAWRQWSRGVPSIEDPDQGNPVANRPGVWRPAPQGMLSPRPERGAAHRAAQAAQPGLAGVLLLLGSVPLVFVLSGFGGPALNLYGFDATGRYVPPVWGGVAVVLGAFLARVWGWRGGWGQVAVDPSGRAGGGSGRALRGGWGRAAAVALAGVVLGTNALSLARTDPVQAFQSPYWSKLPVDSGPLLSTLRARAITHVWMNHWAGFPLMFDARAIGQPLVAYDWYDVQAGGIDRFPEYRPLVEAAERPAFVLVTDEAQPELERRLQQMGVAYDVARVPPYVVVLPTSRTVHPSEVTPALDYRY